jgi:putative resolvase
MKVSIGEAAKEPGVSRETLRQERSRLNAPRRVTGAMTCRNSLVLRPRPPLAGRPTLIFARVSSHDQKEDLIRQVALLESYCAANGWTYEVIQDLGSRMNTPKKGLQQLIKRICSGQVGRLVLTHQDRLLRFGSELVLARRQADHTEVVIINPSEPPLSFEEELHRKSRRQDNRPKRSRHTSA